jgi:hypothetical protein
MHAFVPWLPAQGILFDQSTVIERAQSSDRWTKGPLKDRIAFESGSSRFEFL